jgi:hypothetical protein
VVVGNPVPGFFRGPPQSFASSALLLSGRGSGARRSDRLHRQRLFVFERSGGALLIKLQASEKLDIARSPRRAWSPGRTLSGRRA